MLYYIEQDSNTFNQYNEVMSVALVTNEQVIKALRNYNPWWRNPSAAKEEDRPQHRVAYHETLRIMRHKTIRRFAVLSGARRVGKTTILYQIINHLIDNGVNPRNIFYATFDNPVLKMAGVDMVLSAYDSMYPVEGVRYVFFDEIQYTENWELWMKVIYDSRKDIRLAATGSASPIIEDASTDSGTGRWTVIKIPTLSFYEYCQLLQLDDMPLLPDRLKITDIPKMENAEVADLMARFEPLVKHFNRYLTIGGFPELALSDDDLYAQRMLREDVVDKVIKRDVLTLFKVRSPLLMEKLFLYLCMRHLRGSQVRKRPVDHLRGGCLLFPLLCRRDHNLIGFLFTVDTSLAHGLQIFGAHCNQGGNIHIFTRNTVLDFQLCTWFQMIAVPVSTVIFIFFQNLSHLLKSPAHGSFSGPPVPG